jgi:O-antigen ligase
LARENWLLTVAHSHNGYLEVLVTTGFVGLSLCVVAFLFVPLRRLLRSNIPNGALIFSVLVYCVALNLTETALLERDRPEWVVLLLAVALVHSGVQTGGRASASGDR